MSGALISSRWWIIICFIVIVAVGLIVYHPGLNIGFWTDDYAFLDAIGRLDFPDYLGAYFDPRLQWHWYRPMQGLAWWIGYLLFRDDARGHHILQLVLHLLNACLLFELARAITRRWRPALLAALVYAVLSVDSLAVLWVGVADPLVSFFYLLSLRLWLEYLADGRRRWFVFTTLTLIGALLSKELGATLPVALFLADRWVSAKPTTWFGLARRYALFVFLGALYGLLELNVLTRGLFTNSLGYGAGGHIWLGLAQHAATLAFPWGLPSPVNYVWLALILGLVAVTILRGERRGLFLVALILLTLLPILPFPVVLSSSARYLYLPLMGSAIGVGLAFELLTRRRWMMPLAALIGTGLLVWNSATIAESAVAFEGTARQTRSQFRPIFQAFPTFPPDTLVYFLNPPMQSPYISGLMFLRYGRGVSASGTDIDLPARLSAHHAAWIFYQDDETRWQSISVAKNFSVTTTPNLPARFQVIQLEEFELANPRVKPGQAIGLSLYWRATAAINRDYTIFAQLIDARGQIVAGVDTQPQHGASPTSRWRANQSTADGMVIPVDADVPPGEYSLALGWYDLTTMHRLELLNASGEPMGDHIRVAPIWVIE
ncbi:MAG: glycosyltransferase family 39 protein [Chloroflexi bacterium]|nr:glycosyltransferase family 39 protein [Chloroflexota bacterium]